MVFFAMSTGTKIALTVAVVLVGVFVFGTLRDLVGQGHYLATGIEVVVLIYIWMRPKPHRE